MAAERILIADDNELAALTLQEQLQSLGYEIAGIARSGADAVRNCEQHKPDLMIMNMQLPDLASAAAIKTITERTATPIVLMTTFSDAASLRAVDDAGALAYLVKPVNPDELPPAIDIALARHRDLQQLRNRVHDLQSTIDSRKVVERAKGILMKRLGLTEAEAEAKMRQRAQELNAKLEDVAQTIVDSDALLS